MLFIIRSLNKAGKGDGKGEDGWKESPDLHEPNPRIIKFKSQSEITSCV